MPYKQGVGGSIPSSSTIFNRCGVERRAFASSNSLRVASTHLASLNQLVEEEVTDNNAKNIVQINLLSYRRGVEQSGSSSGS